MPLTNDFHWCCRKELVTGSASAALASEVLLEWYFWHLTLLGHLFGHRSLPAALYPRAEVVDSIFHCPGCLLFDPRYAHLGQAPDSSGRRILQGGTGRALIRLCRLARSSTSKGLEVRQESVE